MSLRHTTEVAGDTRRILVHVPGQRPLTMRMPENGLRWSIAICTLDRDFDLLDGDVEALYERACQIGRPLFRKEAMALLLARRLVIN